MIVLLSLALLLTRLGVCCKNTPVLEERLKLNPDRQPPSSEPPALTGQLTDAEIQLVAEVVKSVLRAVIRSKGQNSPDMASDLESTAEQVLHHLDLSSPSDEEISDAQKTFNQLTITPSNDKDNEIANNDINNNDADTNDPKLPSQPSEMSAVRFDHPTGNEQKQENLDWNKICRLPLLEGMCRGFFPSFGYEAKTGECQQFVYGGCGGNDNRFNTEDECIKTCGKIH